MMTGNITAVQTGSGWDVDQTGTANLQGDLQSNGSIILNAQGAAAVAAATSLIQRIRNSLAQARTINPYINQPWTVASAWVANTVYTIPGQIVTNGGNQYVLQTAGTAAAAGGPSGTGAGPITDNTCKWFYDGPALTASAIPVAPTLTYAAPTGLTKAVAYNTSGAYRFSCGTPTVNSGGYRFPSINISPSAGNAVGNYDSMGGLVIFRSDAPKICIQGAQAYYNNTPMQVEVDGKWLQPGSLVPAATTNPGGLVIDWGAGNRAMRRYRARLYNNFQFTGVYVDPASSVIADVNPNAFKVTVEGDSLTSGSNAIPFLGRDWPTTFGYLIGCDDITVTAAGSTGFIANATNTKTTYLQRLTDVIGFAPEVHIVAGLYNDNGYTSQQRQAAISLYIQSFRAQSSAWLLIFGSTSGSLGAAALATAEADIAASVTASNDSKVVFFPVSTDTVPWIDGTGNVGSAAGNGNADVYVQGSGQPPHYTQAGVDYVARRYAQAWSNFWNSK